MSAEKVIYALLKADPALAALVGDRIYPGFVPMGKPLPALAYNQVSRVESSKLGLRGGTVVVRSRIEVTAQAKTYPSKKAVLDAVRAACKNRQGLIAGVEVDSVLVDTTGPDLRDDDAGIEMQSQDFRVTFHEANP